MDDLVRQGKILYWGFSCWPAEKIRAAARLCGDRLYAPVSSQPHYNLLMRDIEAEVLPACNELGIGQVVFSPLEQGILTGKYRPDEPLPLGTRAVSKEGSAFMSRFLTPEILTAVPVTHLLSDDCPGAPSSCEPTVKQYSSPGLAPARVTAVAPVSTRIAPGSPLRVSSTK